MSYSKEELERLVKELGNEQAWNHAIELPHGVWTTSREQTSHGKNLVKWERIRRYIEQIDLNGKRGLDVGCNEGFFSVQMSKAGAREVVACDISGPRIRKARFVLEALGISNVRLERLDIYNSKFRDLGRFDLALCLGFLHRVPNLYGVIETLVSMADMTLFEWKAYPYGSRSRPLLMYDGRLSIPDDPHSKAYFRPSIGCVVAMLEDQGFSHHFVVDDSHQHRAILISANMDHPLFDRQELIANRSRLALLYRYSRLYAANVRDLLRGRL